jgi:hypothetical protein
VQVYLTGEFSMFLQASLRPIIWFSPPSLFRCFALHKNCLFAALYDKCGVY